MYLIALCDDEEMELDKAESMLKNYQKQHPKQELIIERFVCVEKLLCMVREERFVPDLIFMDIYMPKKMGIDAAKELRNMGNECKLVFLTLSKEHALEAFYVNAVQYLVKPVSEKVLFSLLDRFLQDIAKERKRYLLLRIEGRICRVQLSDIVCCEAQGKTQCLYHTNGSQSLLHMTITEIFEMLSGYQEFVKVGAAYIVNLEHIDSLNAQDVCLDTGKRIYLPRGAYKPLREQYFQYYCEEDYYK